MRTARSHRTSRWSGHASPSGVALDLMRPSDAFAVRATSRLGNPDRWLKTALLLLALAAGLAVVLGAARGGAS